MHVPTTNSESNDSADHRQAGMLSAPADDPTNVPKAQNSVKPALLQIVDDLEQCIRDTYAGMMHYGQRTVVEAHRCGCLLIDAHDTADRREGGFRGVCQRTRHFA